MGLLSRAFALVAGKSPAPPPRGIEIKALYDAAAVGRRTSNWRPVATDANSEIGPAATRLREVARDLVRNNAYARRGKVLIANNVIGAGIMPRIDGGTKQFKDAVQRHFESTDIDVNGQETFYGLQNLICGAVVESGECFVRFRPRRAADGYSLPFQLEVLEADYLDTFVDGVLPNGNTAVQGIEFDAIGRRVAYYLFDRHPGSLFGVSGFSAGVRGKRVAAENIAHVFLCERPGQHRGVTWFTPVILRIRDFGDYTDAQLIRQKIAACYAAFVTTEESATGTPEEGQTYPIEKFEPGMVERLRPGESVEFSTPPTTHDFDPFSRVTLREISIGLGIPYEGLTGDLTGVNYSSGRMGWLEFQRNIDVWRWRMIIPQLCDRVAKWTMQAGSIVMPGASRARFGWTPPRREMIDPAVEIAAAKDAVRAGFSSRSEEVRRFGNEPELIDAENAADNARADEMGLVYETDARKMTSQGQMQAAPSEPGQAAPAQPDVQNMLRDVSSMVAKMPAPVVNMTAPAVNVENRIHVPSKRRERVTVQEHDEHGRIKSFIKEELSDGEHD